MRHTDRQEEYIHGLYARAGRYWPEIKSRAHASRLIQDALQHKWHTEIMEGGSVVMLDHEGRHELVPVRGGWVKR